MAMAPTRKRGIKRKERMYTTMEENIVEEETQPVPGKVKGKPRGFATLSDERKKEIAAMGGRAAQATGRAYRLTPEKASEAGKIGGKASKRGPNKIRKRGKTEQG